MRKVILTTGGTGGHIYPALSIARKLREKNTEVLFIGTKHRMEKDIVPRENFRFIGLDILPLRSLKSIFKMIAATSSTTPSIVENSCNTPSIWISVTAVPGSDDNKIRRNEFPKVVP